jgi:hypothetical protein
MPDYRCITGEQKIKSTDVKSMNEIELLQQDLKQKKRLVTCFEPYSFSLTSIFLIGRSCVTLL